MSTILLQPKEQLWTPSGIDEPLIEKYMNQLLSAKVNEADIYFQKERHESYSLEDGIVKSGNFEINQGVGVRAVSGEKTGFAFTDDIETSAIEQALGAARSITSLGQQARVKIPSRQTGQVALYDTSNPLNSFSQQQKIETLRQLDQAARQRDPRVKQVMCHLTAVYEDILIVNENGIFADIRPLVRVGISVVVEQDGRRETGSAAGGGRFGYDTFFEQRSVDDLAYEAVRLALVNLEARPAPAGEMPVVLGPGWPGVLLHEAVGHGLEGDFNRKGSSVFSGRIGEKVASELCTVVDDGTIPNRRGSLNIDDEGTPTQRNVLIEKGILKGYLQDKMNARLMKTAPTGNGRRESYAYAPMPRMTNTFMLPGSHTQEEIIASVKDGIYAVNFAGGQVDITSGKFVFSTSEAYRIQNGKITYPVKGATLIGNGPEVMKVISMVGPDTQLDEGIGTCGKDGQSVPVGVGLPTVRVDALTVGGTDHGA
ncbi:MAG: metalloprotease TldD [Legionellales bacterium]|nr:metalloprotease TldD [Legionellales bacterium]